MCLREDVVHVFENLLEFNKEYVKWRVESEKGVDMTNAAIASRLKTKIWNTF